MNLTIVTACWRAENLKKVIECIDGQTYKGRVDHILVNDNNPEVREILPALCDDKRRFWIDCHVRGHFFGAVARNIGTMMAFAYQQERNLDNEYILYFDDDNMWEPNHLETMVDALVTNPDATLIASDAKWVGVNDKNWTEIRPCRIRQGACDLGQFMYKNELFKKYNYFNPRPRKKQRYDWELIKKMVDGEGADKVVYTGLPTFMMSYRKR